MTKTLTPTERKAILKRHRWSVNAIARELKLRGHTYSNMAIHHWINNNARLSSEDTLEALRQILARELEYEGIEVEALFNVEKTTVTPL